MKKEQKRKIKFGITSEIVLPVVFSILLFAGLAYYISYNIFSNAMKGEVEIQVENVCSIASKMVDGDRFDEYLESKGESEASQSALYTLQQICDNSDFNYIYLIRPDFENGKVINSLSVHESSNSSLELYEVGQITEITTEDYQKAYERIMDKKSSIEFIYRLHMPKEYAYGDHMTGLAPVYDSKNEIVGIMCAEVSLNWYKETLHSYLVEFTRWLVDVIAFLVMICSLMLHFRVLVPFKKITDETERFANSNTISEHSLADDVKRNNEIGQLAEAIDLMEKQTTDYIENIKKMTSEQHRIAAELDIAAKIQEAVLPHDFPAFPDRCQFDLYATMKPAKEVGGDFYDFFMIDDDHLALIIADVSGKGFPGALYMMVSKIILQNLSGISKDPAVILENVNNKLCEKNDAGMFVTVWLGILEISTGKLRTANAGHENPAVMRGGEKFEFYKEKHGFVLGGMEGMKYKDYDYDLKHGDTIFVYTDGITEAANAENELFGNDRLIEALNGARDEIDLKAFAEKVEKSVSAFVKDAPQADDLTMLVFRYN